jgi:hypothetical protein
VFSASSFFSLVLLLFVFFCSFLPLLLQFICQVARANVVCFVLQTYSYVQNRIGILQQSTPLLFVGMLNCFAVFPALRNIFYRERIDSVYDAGPFFLTYLCGELPFEIVASFCFAACVGPVVGLNSSPSAFFTTVFTSFCLVSSGEAIGILFCAFIYHAGFAISIVNSVLSQFTISAGFLSLQMPAVINVLNAVSVVRYTAELNAVFEFQGAAITCLPGDLVNGVCPFQTGDQVRLATTAHGGVQSQIMWA